MTLQSIWDPEVDFGTPAVQAVDTVSVTIDGHQVDVPAGTSVLRAATEAGVAIPKLCATDSLKAFGSCRMCLVEVDGARGVPASCTTPCSRRHGRQHPDRHRPRPAPQRHGALPLRPPRGLRRLRPRQLRDPGAGRAGRRRRGPLRPARDARRRRPPAADRPEQPVLRLRRLRLHRLLPLRARLRRHPGHLRAHRRGPRLRLQDQRRRHRLHVVGVRLVRRLRAGLPDVRAPGEVDRRSSACRRARSRPPAPTAASAARSAPRSRATATTPASSG